MYKTCVILHAIYLICSSFARKTVMDKLYDDLLSEYNAHLPPLAAPNQPVIVNTSFYLNGIEDFDEVTGKFSFVGFIHFRWDDFRIKWNPTLYNNTKFIEIPETNVWKPNPTLINPYQKVKDVATGLVPVLYDANGSASWNPIDVMSSRCEVDITYYPFDTQVCQLIFSCWGYSIFSIQLGTIASKANLFFYNKHGTWELVNSTWKSYPYLGFLILDVTIRRQPAFAVLNFILPVVLISFMNVLVFALPIESGERVSYSITVLLAIAVFLTLVGNNLPKTSHPTSILSYYLLSILIISGVVGFLVMISLSMFYSDEKRPIPNLIVRIVNCRLCKKISKTSTYSVKEALTSGDVNITWKMVSKWFDRIALAFCLAALAFSTILFSVLVM